MANEENQMFSGIDNLVQNSNDTLEGQCELSEKLAKKIIELKKIENKIAEIIFANRESIYECDLSKNLDEIFEVYSNAFKDPEIINNLIDALKDAKSKKIYYR